MSVSWNSHQVRTDEVLPLPTTAMETASNVAHRFALNDTDDGYSGPYRTFEDWEELLDVLAFHGFNEVFMPVGAEKVYYELLQRYGYTAQEALKWLPLPAHQPWWLLQNLYGVNSPTTLQLVEQRAALGRQIADRTRELGMVPVLPGYYGSVPTDSSGRNGNVNVVGQGGWVGGYVRPSWLDPTTAKFAQVAADFYTLMEQTLGHSSVYKMDLLHEGGTPGAVNVTQAATAVQNALLAAHPDAIWVLLGWEGNPRASLLNGTDKSKVLIVDGLSDRYNPANREAEWVNTPYAFGSIWNFGGHTTMGAWTDVWNQVYWNSLAKSGSKLNGIAMLPEGAYNNPLAMDELASLPWRDGPSNMTDVYHDWADRRYGAEDPNARQAWQILAPRPTPDQARASRRRRTACSPRVQASL